MKINHFQSFQCIFSFQCLLGTQWESNREKKKLTEKFITITCQLMSLFFFFPHSHWLSSYCNLHFNSCLAHTYVSTSFVRYQLHVIHQTMARKKPCKENCNKYATWMQWLRCGIAEQSDIYCVWCKCIMWCVYILNKFKLYKLLSFFITGHSFQGLNISFRFFLDRMCA